jgi:hypothetical protein
MADQLIMFYRYLPPLEASDNNGNRYYDAGQLIMFYRYLPPLEASKNW